MPPRCRWCPRTSLGARAVFMIRLAQLRESDTETLGFVINPIASGFQAIVTPHTVELLKCD